MDNQKSYYAIIPANVRYDEDLIPNAKLLYGEITALCNEKGYCWATNQYFAELYKVSKVSISKWVSNLEKKGYITIEMIYKEGSKEILYRYIRIVNDPIKEKFNTPQRKVNDPIKEKFNDNNTINTKYNNTNNIITGKAPVIEKTKNTSLFSETNKQSTKQKRFKDIQDMKDMILGYTNNKNIRDKLTEYFNDRVKKRLQPNQWQIILADLKNYCGENQELTINQINSAIAGGYMTIIPAWEKNKKFTNNRNNFDNTSKKVKHRIAPGYGEIAEEEPKNISSERF